MTFVKIIDSSYVREMDSKSLVETDIAKRDEYKNKVALMKNIKDQDQKVSRLEQRLDSVEVKIDSIIRLLEGLNK